jgi:uncharacterized membrane protein YcaP (DUF421 family)
MDPAKFALFDPRRLLIGEQPASFLIEMVVRALVTYIILLLAARLLGKRVAGELSVLELTIIVTLGAAISVPLEMPDRGMLPAVIVLAVAVLYQRVIGMATFRSRRAGHILEGRNERLVIDGRVIIAAIEKLAISRERLFAMLRQLQILELGQVKRAYFEANGELTLLKIDKPPPGLAILPSPDREDYERRFAVPGHWACESCGVVVQQQDEPHRSCEHCKCSTWTPAVRVISAAEL